MKISAIATGSSIQYSTNFRSTDRIVTKKFASRVYSNYTEFLRCDLDWKKLLNLLKEKYKNTPQISILNHACSDGSEPISLAMLIKQYIPNAQRFFPIKAYDYDDFIIDKAKNEPTYITDADYERLEKILPDWNKKYLEKDNGYRHLVNRKDELKKDIIFEQKNILDDFNEDELKNTVVLARNCWAYLENFEQKILIYKLINALDPSCLLVIGALEKTYGINKLLEENGFRKTEVEYVYEPPID